MTQAVLVTGATGLIGAVVSKALLDAGYAVVAVSRSLDRVKTEISSTDTNLYPLVADLSNDAAVREIVEEINRRQIEIVAVIHAARDLRSLKKRSQLRMDDWVLEYRLAAALPYELLYRLHAEHAIRSAVLISSMYGVIAQNPSLYDGNTDAFAPHYAASKAAVIHLTKQLAVELAPNTRVNCVSYGGVEGRADETFRKRYSELTPSRRMLTKKDLAGPVQFLLDETVSSGITGQNIIVDGGWSIW